MKASLPAAFPTTPSETGEEFFDRGPRVGRAGHRARYENSGASQFERASDIATVMNSGAAQHSGVRGDGPYGSDGPRDDLRAGRRNGTIAPDELRGFYRQIGRTRLGQAPGGGDVAGAHDRNEPERAETLDRVADVDRRDRVLGVVDEAPPSPGGSDRLWRYKAGVSPAIERVNVLGQHRDPDGGRDLS
jgi:hypothetical protein